jgi:hypothetical protein
MYLAPLPLGLNSADALSTSQIQILDPDPAIFVIDLQGASKKNNFLTQFFLPVTF